jgi:hypothetical protein
LDAQEAAENHPVVSGTGLLDDFRSGSEKMTMKPEI